MGCVRETGIRRLGWASVQQRIAPLGGLFQLNSASVSNISEGRATASVGYVITLTASLWAMIVGVDYLLTGVAISLR